MNINANEIITYKHKRVFIQYGGASPLNTVKYQGVSAQYVMIESASVPESGGIEPIWAQDKKIGKYRLIGQQISPPDIPTASLTFYEKHGGIPRQLLGSCPFNAYEVTGKCADLTDFKNGWDDYILVYEHAIVTSKDLGQRTSLDTDEKVTNSLDVALAAIYPVGPLNFGIVAADEIGREVADVVFGSQLNNCAGCKYGDEYIYAVTKPSGAASPGLPAEVIYSVDSGSNWSEVNIDSLGSTEETYAIAIVGSYLVVLGEDAYYYAEINKNSGVPGTFSKVTTGFSAGNSPKDIFVADSGNIYFVGDNGYIYKSTNITGGVSISNAGSATTENLSRVSGLQDDIVAVGENGAIVQSKNAGATWASITAPDDSNYLSVQVLSDNRMFVGCETEGLVYFTDNDAATWNAISLGLTSGNIKDLMFVTESIGFAAVENTASGSVGEIYATWDGGYNWVKNSPRITNLPTFDCPNRLAAPDSDDPGVAANTLAVAGLAGDAEDGVLFLGISAKI